MPKVSGDWWRHLGMQLGTQFVFWLLAYLAKVDWSAFGPYAPGISAAIAFLTTIATEAFNQALATPVAGQIAYTPPLPIPYAQALHAALPAHVPPAATVVVDPVKSRVVQSAAAGGTV